MRLIDRRRALMAAKIATMPLVLYDAGAVSAKYGNLITVSGLKTGNRVSWEVLPTSLHNAKSTSSGYATVFGDEKLDLSKFRTVKMSGRQWVQGNKRSAVSLILCEKVQEATTLSDAFGQYNRAEFICTIDQRWEDFTVSIDIADFAGNSSDCMIASIIYGVGSRIEAHINKIWIE